MSKKLDSRVGADLTQGNILRQLLIFVFPLLLTNVVQQLYNTVDMIVIGQYVGATGTVGVSQGGEVATMVTFMASAFGSAAQIYIAQLFGGGKKKEISETMMTALLFTAILSAACMAICILGCDLFLDWLNCPPEALDQARDYMIIVSLGLPFIFGYNTVCGILRGLGESKRPLYFILVAAVSNIFMDILLVAVIPLEAAGTAIATITAQFASFVAAFIFLYKRRSAFGIEFKRENIKIVGQHLNVLLKLGIPMAFSSAFIHGSQLICGAHINQFGLVASATNSIGNKVQKLINVFCNSVNHGSGAMVAQNIGAKKFDRVRKIVYTAATCSAVLASLAVIIGIFYPREAFRLFTDDKDVIELGVTYMHICLISFVSSPFHGSFSAVISGSGNSKLSFFASMLDGVVLRLGISFVLGYTFNMGVVGFFYGNTIAKLAPTIIGVIYFYSNRWTTRKLLGES